jgi:GTPase
MILLSRPLLLHWPCSYVMRLYATASRMPRARASFRKKAAPRLSRGRSPATAPCEQTGLLLAIVGRPNVGKSTLFNRLARRAGDKERAGAPFVPSVVDSFSGVTRDARTTYAALGNLVFELVDTAGLEIAPRVAGRNSGRKEEFKRRAPGTPGAHQSLVAAGALDQDVDYRAMYWGMSAATCHAVELADAALFMIDAAAGVTAVDQDIARWLRSSATAKPIVLLANKCDMSAARAGVADALLLGFGDPVGISAEHSMGLAELYAAIEKLHTGRKEMSNAISPASAPGSHFSNGAQRLTSSETSRTNEISPRLDKIPSLSDTVDAWDIAYDPDCAIDEPIRRLIVAILGRPNVGKSTLMNRLLNRGQAIVGPASGVTRDALFAEWSPKCSDADPLWIVDTAGVRTRPQAGENRVELESIKSSMRAMRMAHLVVIVVDATEPFTGQDVRLVEVAITEGRAIVLVINKMDCVQHPEHLANLREIASRHVRTALSEISGVEIVEMSAKDWNDDDGQATRLYEAIQRARSRWERRIPTSALTRFLHRFNELRSIGRSRAKGNNPPAAKFMSQRKVRPPVFRLDGSSAVSDNYIKSLTNAIRQEFGFQGVPIRIRRPSNQLRK